jgi:hypothetical protein
MNFQKSISLHRLFRVWLAISFLILAGLTYVDMFPKLWMMFFLAERSTWWAILGFLALGPVGIMIFLEVHRQNGLSRRIE